MAKRPFLIDLYGTLVRPGSGAWRERSAQLLGMGWDELRGASDPSFMPRMLGHIRTPEETIADTLRRLGREVDDETRAALVEARWSFFHTITLFDDSLPALDRLRDAGHPLALVSNCSAEAGVALDRLGLRARFDVLALSCDVGAAKPDPAIYRYACTQLHVDPAACIFAGDGESNEHAGARALGMTTVWVKRPGAPERDVAANYTIASLLELFDLPGMTR